MQNQHNSRHCKFASFSGIDGAGKSTQIANLRARLQDAGMRVALITFWDDVARLKGIREGAGHTLFKGEKGVGSPEKPVNRRDKNVRSWPMSLVRLGLYFVDALSLRATVGKALHSGADFVICDRYIYDELANLNLGNPATRVYVRMIMKLVPRPDVSYFLDADPVAARARKPEYPLDFLHLSRASYFTLIKLIGGITVIPPMSIKNAEREVMRHALEVLSSGELQNQPAEHLVSER
ncbi:MAG TPA: thymidylate kinase [Acidobacteriaceae bacterium]|jgi:thymidylate kinase